LASASNDLRGVVLNLLDHQQHARQLGFAGLGIDLATDVVLAAVT
jgi:hypothetical protein